MRNNDEELKRQIKELCEEMEGTVCECGAEKQAGADCCEECL